ncbi:MAG: ABC transporter permease [Bacteroidia bacterium]|nr:ABC transporter permease [Bacteroidia bacterium]
MTSYLFRRILSFIPTLLAVILASFLLLKLSPGDPVERIIGSAMPDEKGAGSAAMQEQTRSDWRHRLGLDLPVFYISIKPWSPASEGGVKSLIPVLKINPDNQFHRYLFGNGNFSAGLLHGDFGMSYATRQPAGELIYDRIGWSLFFTLLSVVLAYLIAIPIGLKAGSNPGSPFARRSDLVLTFLFSLPAFWVATLLLMTFCNPDVIHLLPASGVKPVGGYPEGMPFLQRILKTIPYLIVPTICYTYSSLAFVSRTLQVTITDLMKEDYIRTARAKGLPEKLVVKKHAYRNALLPVITLFTGVFPFALSGSVILETIFSIPGMGYTIYQSVADQDYPVIIAVFTITGVITMAGFLISDILYALADPRISLYRKKIPA